MRQVFLTVCLASAAEYLFGGSAHALECENDATSLLQTNVLHSKAHRRYVAVDNAPKSLEEIQKCLSQLAEVKEVKEQDIKISDTELTSIVHQVKACAGEYGMEEEEYLAFMTYVRDHAPQRLLVWGLGADSIVLDLLNYGGDTLFLEPDLEWIEVVQETVPGKALHVVHFDETLFNTTVADYPEFILSPHRADTIGVLDGQPCWDTVLVDSPMGSETNPTEFTGRAVPMYTAFTDIERCKSEGKYPANAEVSVFVHDSTRALEDNVAKAFFKTETLQKEVGPKKLRVFCLTCSTPSNSTDAFGALMDDLSWTTSHGS